MAGKVTNRIFWIVTIAVALIAIGSFSLSFLALKELAISNGVPSRLAFVWPLIVDVSVIVFTAAILVSQLQGRGAMLAIGLTGFYAVVTIIGNILHAPITWLGWFVAALPPLSLIFATEMLRAMAHHNIVTHNSIATLDTIQNEIVIKQAEFDQMVTDKQTTLDKLQAEFDRLNKTIQDKQAAESMTIAPNVTALAQANDKRQSTIEQRRQNILSLLDNGLSPDDIAGQVGVSVRTVKRDIQRLNGQVGVTK